MTPQDCKKEMERCLQLLFAAKGEFNVSYRSMAGLFEEFEEHGIFCSLHAQQAGVGLVQMPANVWRGNHVWRVWWPAEAKKLRNRDYTKVGVIRLRAGLQREKNYRAEMERRMLEVERKVEELQKRG